MNCGEGINLVLLWSSRNVWKLHKDWIFLCEKGLQLKNIESKMSTSSIYLTFYQITCDLWGSPQSQTAPSLLINRPSQFTTSSTVTNYQLCLQET